MTSFPFPDRFVAVQAPGAKRSSNQDSEGGRVHPSGRIVTNVACAELILAQVKKKFQSVSECGIFWAADPNTGEIAGVVVGPDVIGVTPIRENKKEKTLSLYANGVFDNQPKLRPSVKRWVAITSHSTPDKGDYFIVHLNLALVRRRTKSAKSSDAAKADGAKQGAQEAAKQAKEQVAAGQETAES